MLQQIQDYLYEHNLRITPQRRAILHVLYEYRDQHLEAENIYELLVNKGLSSKKIGLSTVYRTMELFNKLGIVSKLSFESAPARYELIMPKKLSHHHLICLNCGEMEEVEDLLTTEFKQQILQEKGFTIADKSMKIYGYCKNCQSKT